MSEPNEAMVVHIGIPALKQMIAWSLLCLGLIERKDEDFDLITRLDGIMVVRRARGKV